MVADVLKPYVKMYVTTQALQKGESNSLGSNTRIVAFKSSLRLPPAETNLQESKGKKRML